MKSVVIADDNAVGLELLGEMLRDTLQPLGVEVIEASNGAEALEAIRKHSPFAALIDIQMPVLDGFGVIAGVRAGMSGGTPFMIALTALAMDSDRVRILAAGFDAYLAKPISIVAVRDMVKAVVARQNPPAGL